MVNTAIQLFTLRHFDVPTPDVVSQVSNTTFDGVELYDAHFDAFTDQTVNQTNAALDDAGLAVAGAHIRADRIESEFEHVIRVCDVLDCSRLIIPTYDHGAFASVAGIEGAADRIAGLASDLDNHGIELLYHNHTFEFDRVGDDIAFELFVDYADDRFSFEPDVGLATHAGYDGLDLLDLVTDQAPLVHLTDTKPDDPDQLHTDVGTGVVDVKACADAAVENGAEWLICENGSTATARTSLEHGSEAFATFRERTAESPQEQ